MTPEERRILWAAREGRLSVSRHGRYIIEGDLRPVFDTDRENLQRQGVLDWEWLRGDWRPYLTPAGYSVLAKDARHTQVEQDRADDLIEGGWEVMRGER